MSTSATLPSSLRRKLTEAIRRLRFLRIVRALSVSVIVLAVAAAAAMLADSALDLPAEARGLVLVGRREQFNGCDDVRQPDPEAVAAAIEEQFPWLAERLTTSIELSKVVDEFHGSSHLVARLINETESQSHRLNFQEAFPARRSAQLCSTAIAVVLVVLSPALLWPDRYAGLGLRFFFPWQDVKAVPFALEVSPGDAFAARGRPLTVTAHLLRQKEGVRLPQSCILVRVDSNGLTSQDRMAADGDGFSFTIAQVASL